MTKNISVTGAVAQMNWGQMRYPLDHPAMAEFQAALDPIYSAAESSRGFIWRIGEDQLALELAETGHDNLTSATVSVWESLECLKQYTFETAHGDYLKRNSEWFEIVDGPQLVIWMVGSNERPGFKEAVRRLNILKQNGPTGEAFGWLS